MWFQHCARMTFQGQKYDLRFWPPKKVWIDLLQIFFGNGFLLREDIHKVWRGCLVLFQRYDFLKSCLPIILYVDRKILDKNEKWQSQKPRDLLVEKNHANAFTQGKVP